MKKINFEVGQDVWCILNGRGKITDIYPDDTYAILVAFEESFTRLAFSDSYTWYGQHDEDQGRTLFFSEPVITAETEPPKPKFKPNLIPDETVVVLYSDDDYYRPASVLRVRAEMEDRILFSHPGSISSFAVYKSSIRSINRLEKEPVKI